MAPAFPKSGSPSPNRPRGASHPVAITCLQWDSDGALNDHDHQLLLQILAASDPFGGILLPGDQRHGRWWHDAATQAWHQ